MAPYPRVMGREPRIEVPGGIYHLGSRGNRSCPIYMDDDERGSSVAATPVPPHSVDPFCASACQSKGHPLDSCNRACGF